MDSLLRSDGLGDELLSGALLEVARVLSYFALSRVILKELVNVE